MRDPFAAPLDANGLPPAARPAAGAVRRGGDLRALLSSARSDIAVGVVVASAGVVLGILAGLAWYRLAPTVWLTLPADAVSQLKTGSGVDQSALLVSPEGKGIASVDGYYFLVTSVAGLLLGTLAFYLGRRGFGQRGDNPPGAAVGAWAGVLVGGCAASTLAASLGRWVSLPDALTVLRRIADGRAFHATVALHATGLYFAAPILALVLFAALTSAFTKAPPQPEWVPYDERMGQGYFTSDNPYGFSTPPIAPPAPTAPSATSAAPPVSTAPTAPTGSTTSNGSTSDPRGSGS